MSDLFEKTLVFDNGKVEWYVNHLTKDAEKWAEEWGLKGIKCYLTIQKSNKDDVDYVLVQNGEAIHATKSFEALAVHIDMMAAHEGLKRQDRW